jgi:hypothetical protein
LEARRDTLSRFSNPIEGLSRKVGSSQSQAQKPVSATPQPQRKANTPLENNTDFEKK